MELTEEAQTCLVDEIPRAEELERVANFVPSANNVEDALLSGLGSCPDVVLGCALGRQHESGEGSSLDLVSSRLEHWQTWYVVFDGRDSARFAGISQVPVVLCQLGDASFLGIANGNATQADRRPEIPEDIDAQVPSQTAFGTPVDVCAYMVDGDDGNGCDDEAYGEETQHRALPWCWFERTPWSEWPHGVRIGSASQWAKETGNCWC